MQYRRTPLNHGSSPSDKICTDIDVLLPSPAHIAQHRQARKATKSQLSKAVKQIKRAYKVGTPCYALCFGTRQAGSPRWIPAIITKVRCLPQGNIWKRHWEQLQPRMVSDEDNEPGEDITTAEEDKATQAMSSTIKEDLQSSPPEYGRHNLRRSRRIRGRRQAFF